MIIVYVTARSDNPCCEHPEKSHHRTYLYSVRMPSPVVPNISCCSPVAKSTCRLATLLANGRFNWCTGAPWQLRHQWCAALSIAPARADRRPGWPLTSLTDALPRSHLQRLPCGGPGRRLATLLPPSARWSFGHATRPGSAGCGFADSPPSTSPCRACHRRSAIAQPKRESNTSRPICGCANQIDLSSRELRFLFFRWRNKEIQIPTAHQDAAQVRSQQPFCLLALSNPCCAASDKSRCPQLMPLAEHAR